MKKFPRRVVHVTSGLGLGGAETMLYRLVRLLHRPGEQEHSIITLTDGSSFDFSSFGVPVEVVDLRGKGLFRGLAMLRSTIRTHQPDLVQGWMYHGNFASALCAPRGVPVAWSIHHSLHGLKQEKLQTKILIWMGKLASRLKSTRKIVYVSERSRQHHCSYGYAQDKAAVIPNGFDCKQFSPSKAHRDSVRSELGFTDQHIVLGSFGRYHPIKDHELLLRAFASASAHFPLARLLLAGSDVDYSNSKLVCRIRELGIENRVTLIGPRSDMPRLYNGLDSYVLSSRSESFPNVLGEACACGVPAITTDVGDAALIVGQSGLVVPAADEIALSEAMRRMLSMTPSERHAMGLQARDHIVGRYDLSLIAMAYDACYAQLKHSNA
jgi:glycosyltransferase involved in cell wall biosynthesis